jgi:hypothetical protein
MSHDIFYFRMFIQEGMIMQPQNSLSILTADKFNNKRGQSYLRIMQTTGEPVMNATLVK